MAAALKVGVIAGEVSGDLLGGDLIAALKSAYPGPIELIGVGGDQLAAQGLDSLFDFSELSIMGITQVLARLPSLIRRINQTADAIVAARPDVLIIIDSPDFTHRVAKKVRAKLPDLPVVNYVCPSVWAWKEYRAQAMLAYVDRVLAVLPFEPEVMKRLGGPETFFVGHRLTADPNIVKVRDLRAKRPVKRKGEEKTLLLLPGSRSAEIKALLPDFRLTVDEFVARNGACRLLLPTVSRREALVRELIADWPVKPQVLVTQDEKWGAFVEADMALAASGTVVLELALATVPSVSCYRTDWLIKLMAKRIKVWSGALPNIITDYPVVPEHINEMVRPGYLCRWAECLSHDTPQRHAMLSGFEDLWQRLATAVPAGEASAGVVLDLLEKRKAALPLS